jgi:Glycosyl transferase family 11.
MKVIHIDSGLGNQMLAYCVVLSIQKANSQDEIYIETLVYDIPECNEVISQWNGCELERIFGIKTPNVRTLFSIQQWDKIISEVRQSEFWIKRWNYPPYITNALNHAGLKLVNKRGDLMSSASEQHIKQYWLYKLKQRFFDGTSLGALIKIYIRKRKVDTLKLSCAHPDRLFLSTDEDIFTGMWLDFKFNGNRIEDIHNEIMETFKFPPLDDQRNLQMAEYLDSNNSVFIHARRGDMLSSNGWCYKYGYFKRAVRYIKVHVDNPVFVFFTNEGSVEWCKQNAKKIFGLDKSDQISFVDWNLGDQSFRDMQLMTHCKHGIITNSTFGWWGAYFIQNPNKITISPQAEINTTYHC